MIKGDVLFWPDFKYRDGGTPSNKLVLIAGVDKYKDALLFRTTSRDGGYRPDQDGCHSDEGLFRFKSNPKPFNEPTWVQYDDPYTLSIPDIQAKGIEVHFSLSTAQIQSVINCLRRSQEYAKWLEDYLV